jgi:hypothetical protein
VGRSKNDNLLEAICFFEMEVESVAEREAMREKKDAGGKCQGCILSEAARNVEVENVKRGRRNTATDSHGHKQMPDFLKGWRTVHSLKAGGGGVGAITS